MHRNLCVANFVRACWPYWSAATELFDTAAGDLSPCFRHVSQMLEGGALGTVTATVEPDLQNFSLHIGGDTYVLKNGKLALAKRKN
ncbi:MAG: hypothetical protein ACREO9_01825 [Lysobacterales bacterium]